jgi:hypothetical protein
VSGNTYAYLPCDDITVELANATTTISTGTIKLGVNRHSEKLVDNNQGDENGNGNGNGNRSRTVDNVDNDTKVDEELFAKSVGGRRDAGRKVGFNAISPTHVSGSIPSSTLGSTSTSTSTSFSYSSSTGTAASSGMIWYPTS